MERYLLMHKDIPAAIIELDKNDINARPYKVLINKNNFEHFPLGGQMNNVKFINWWNDRAIPKTRQGAKSALQRLGYKSVGNAMIDNLALSLNDCYWIKPINSDLMWKDVNLFTNKFEDRFGELTFNKDSEVFDLRNKTKFKFAVSQGEVQKKWCIDDNDKRYMVKGNYGNSYQQSINEIFASEMHKAQGFKEYTPYYFAKISLENGKEGLGCKSYNFCNENIESISAWELLQTVKIKQNMSLYYPFKEICLKMGMKEDYFDYFMDYEIITDYLLTNTDRHMNNISILRNPDTLKIIGFAPIYDSGNSMFYSTPTNQIENKHIGKDKIHSFITSQENKLLKYVKDRNVVDINKLNLNFDIYNKDVDISRKPLLETLFERKINDIQAFQQGIDIWKTHTKNIYIQSYKDSNEILIKNVIKVLNENGIDNSLFSKDEKLVLGYILSDEAKKLKNLINSNQLSKENVDNIIDKIKNNFPANFTINGVVYNDKDIISMLEIKKDEIKKHHNSLNNTKTEDLNI